MTGPALSTFPRCARLRTGGRDTTLSSAFVGRQPIFDRNLAVYGYELLYRRGHQNEAVFSDADAASAEVALDAYLEFGLDTLVAERRAFLNISRNLLVSGFCRELPADRVVLEILEGQSCDSHMIREVASLQAGGYQVALDDFVPGDGRDELLPYSSLVKLEIDSLGEDALRARMQLLEEHQVAVVAERIETPAQLERCQKLGIHYFQGFFFAHPTRLIGRRVPVERVTALNVLALLADENSSVEALTEAVAADVKLTYQVLRLVNSAYSALVVPIDSLSDAIVRLGRDRLRGWIGAMALSGVTGKPPEILALALVRARMCEALGRRTAAPSPAGWYTAGLLSALDVLFDAPLARLLEGLHLPSYMIEGLTNRSGRLGEALTAVIAFERGNFAAVQFADVTADEFTLRYRAALRWTQEWEAALAAA